eukprot:3215213-Amphidinium_carterae.1
MERDVIATRGVPVSQCQHCRQWSVQCTHIQSRFVGLEQRTSPGVCTADLLRRPPKGGEIVCAKQESSHHVM